MRSTLVGSLAFAFAIAWSIGDVAAFQLRKMRLKERIASSDLIFVGTMIGDGGSDPDAGNYGSSMLRVDATFKGTAPAAPQRFVAKGQMVEERASCCEQGAMYLVFASRRKDGSLVPVNGPYSTFKIEGDVVLEWPNGEPEERGDWGAVRNLIDSEVAQQAESPFIPRG